MHKKKIIIAALISIIFAILALALISAAPQLLCLSKGQKVEFSKCNPSIRDYTCKSSLCMQCVTTCSNGAVGPASLNACNSLSSQSCERLNTPTLDSNPPSLTITNPQENALFSSPSIDLMLQSDETVDLAFMDLTNPVARWTNICKSCDEYTKRRSFRDGLNNIMFRASDDNNNEAFVNRSFRVDSQMPKIIKTMPKRGFASSIFEVEFREQNPVSLILHYGNELANLQHAVNIATECTPLPSKQSCQTSVDLSSLDGQTIQYWFALTDVVGSTVTSRPVTLVVDTTPPQINNINALASNRAVIFNITVAEQNLQKITYIDESSSLPREISFCTRLTNGGCVKRISLLPGEHTISFQVTDKAGNAVAQSITVNV